jgi:hypothetical protein
MLPLIVDLLRRWAMRKVLCTSARVSAFACLMLIIGAWSSGSWAQELGFPYYMIKSDFGLSVALEGQTRRIVMYVPDHTLIYKDPKPLTTQIEGSEYRSVITEHGIRLLVQSMRISKVPLSTTYGTQPIVFHEDEYLCPDNNPDCDDSEDNRILVRKGDVLNIDEAHSKGGSKTLVTNLLPDSASATSPKLLTGVVMEARYRDWESTGIITDARSPHPPMLLEEVRPFKSLGTTCDMEREEVDLNALKAELDVSVSAHPLKLISFLRLISDALDLTLEAKAEKDIEKTTKLTSKIGRKGQSLQFYQVKVRNLPLDPSATAGTRVFFVAAALQCIGIGEASTPIFIRNVYIKEGEALIGAVDFFKLYSK